MKFLADTVAFHFYREICSSNGFRYPSIENVPDKRGENLNEILRYK